MKAFWGQRADQESTKQSAARWAVDLIDSSSVEIRGLVNKYIEAMMESSIDRNLKATQKNIFSVISIYCTDIISILLSNRYEKRYQILERLFVVFFLPINIPWKISEPIIVKPNGKKIDEDWILVIIFVIGTALILAFLIYFLLYLFKNYKNQPQGPPMTRLINSFQTVSGARPSWLKRSNDFGGTRSSALKSYCDTTGDISTILKIEGSIILLKYGS